MMANDDAAFVIKDPSWDDEGWTRVPNEIVRDRALSLEAKGLILVVASHAADFKIHLPALRLQVGVGREKLQRIMKELEGSGYLLREATYQVVGGRSRRGPNRYILARSRTSVHVTGFQAAGDQAAGNPSFEDLQTTGFQAVEESPGQVHTTAFQQPGSQTPGNPTSFKKTSFKKTKSVKNTPSITPQPTAEFDEFWAAYPKKVSKGGARRKYELAIRKGVDPSHILAAVKRYAESKQGTDRQFIKDPTTWLNQECWDDEIPPAPTQLPIPTQLPSWRRSSTFVTPSGRLIER